MQIYKVTQWYPPGNGPRSIWERYFSEW